MIYHSSILRRSRARTKPRRSRKAVSSVIGGILVFAILFTVGFGYFMSANQDYKSLSSSLQQQSQEQFIVYSTETLNGNVGVQVNNTGPIAIAIAAIIMSNATGYVIKMIASSPASFDTSNPKLPLGVNSGQGSVLIDTGVPMPFSNLYTIKVVTQRGTAEEFYPQANLARLAGVTDGLGSFGLVYNSFKFYYAAAYQYGDGYLTSGYFGFEIPYGQPPVFQLKVTNYDPSGRALTIDERSAVYISGTGGPGAGNCAAGSTSGGGPPPPGGQSGQCFFIVSDLVNNATGCSQNLNLGKQENFGTINGACVGAYSFGLLTVAYGQTVLLNFSASAPGCSAFTFSSQKKPPPPPPGGHSSCSPNGPPPPPGGVGIRGDAPIFLLLFGSYSDGTLFGQTIPFVSSYGTTAMISPTYTPGENGAMDSCAVGSLLNGNCVGTNAPTTGYVLNVQRGQTYYLNLLNFNATSSVLWVWANGQVQNITALESSTQPQFTIPSNANVGSYYSIYAFDGINAAYATVDVTG